MDESHLLYIYDRTPNGWDPIYEEMDQTNSVWVMRISAELEKPVLKAVSDTKHAAKIRLEKPYIDHQLGKKLSVRLLPKDECKTAVRVGIYLQDGTLLTKRWLLKSEMSVENGTLNLSGWLWEENFRLQHPDLRE